MNLQFCWERKRIIYLWTIRLLNRCFFNDFNFVFKWVKLSFFETFLFRLSGLLNILTLTFVYRLFKNLVNLLILFRVQFTHLIIKHNRTGLILHKIIWRKVPFALVFHFYAVYFLKMKWEITLLSKLQIAIFLITSVRLNLIMHIHMLRQVLLLTEAPIADFALVRFFV